MTGTVKTLIALGSVGGTGSLAIGGIYLSSKETIGDIVKGKVLGTLTEFDDSWRDQHKKLLSHKGELSSDLKKIRENHTNSDLHASIEALKNWCKGAYAKTYKTSLSKANDSLMKEVRTYCIQSIKEKLQATLPSGEGNKVLSGTGDSSGFIENYKLLKNHNDSDHGVLDPELSPLKENSDTKANDNWEILQRWCDKHHDAPFKGGTDLFKNLKKYCTKTAAAAAA